MRTLTDSLKNLFFLIKPYWKYGKLMVLADVAIALIISPLTAWATVMFTQTAINELAAGSPFFEILKAIIVYELVITACILLQAGYHICYRDKREKRLQVLVNRSIYEQVLRTDYVYFDNAEFYDGYAMAVNELVAKSAEAANLLVSVVSSVSTLTAMAAMILAVGPLSVLIVAAGIVAGIMVGAKQNRLSIGKYLETLPLDRKLSYIHRVFYMNDFAADLRVTGVRRFLIRDYDEAGDKEAGVIAKYASRFIGWSIFDNAFSRACSFGIVLYLVYGIVSGGIGGIGAFTGQIYAANQLSSSLSVVIGLANRVNSLSLYARRIRAFYELESKIEPPPAPGAAPAPGGAYSLDMKGVCFSYPNSQFAIRDLNVSAGPGEKIAIVGENGAGKSTLMKLLLRLYDADSGAIEINGLPLGDYDIHRLRERIGIALQKPALYSLSLRENIEAYRRASDAEIGDILKKTGLDAVLKKNGADVGSVLTREFDDKGVVLSGGEAQRLAIARVLCGDFGLLLLDEPSSALDPLAEYELTKLIFDSSNKATTVLIAHRLSTVRDADRIYVLDGGAVIESGRHEELMARKGKYCEMFLRQAENYVR